MGSDPEGENKRPNVATKESERFSYNLTVLILVPYCPIGYSA